MALDVVNNTNGGNEEGESKGKEVYVKTSGKIARIEVDRDLCIGAESCVVVAPEAYYMDEENIAVVKEGALDVDEQTLMESAQACPVAAVLFYDKDGKQIYP